jgi:hypothetical protein
MKILYEWKVEELDTTDRIGCKLVLVHETLSGGEIDEHTFGPMPGYASDSFIRIRRLNAAKRMRDSGAFNSDEVFGPLTLTKE